MGLWDYLRSPAKNLYFCLQGIWLIGHRDLASKDGDWDSMGFFMVM
jgi:hypothetical protein